MALTGAWCNLAPRNPCVVQAFSTRTSGSQVWVWGPKPGNSYAVADFNSRFGYNFPCSAQCPGCSPSDPPPDPPPQPPTPPSEGESIPPSSPVTGPQPDPQPCGPGSGISISNRGGFGTDQHFGEPQVGAFTASALREPGGDGEAKRMTTVPEVRSKDGIVWQYHPGTGPGVFVFNPPELRDKKKFRTTNQWPAKLSQSTLLMLSGDADNGAKARQLLAFGLLHEEKPTPRLGVYADYDPATRNINFQMTDADAEDESVGSISFNGAALAAGGDVTAPANIPANSIVIGSDGAKAIKGSGWAIDDDNWMQAPTGEVGAGSDLPPYGFDGTGAGMWYKPAAGGDPAALVLRAPDGANQIEIAAGKTTVVGRLDPESLELTPVASNPAASDTLEDSTLWADSGNDDQLMYGAEEVAYAGDVVAKSGDTMTGALNITANLNELQTWEVPATGSNPKRAKLLFKAAAGGFNPQNPFAFTFTPADDSAYSVRAMVTVRRTDTVSSKTIETVAHVRRESGTTTITQVRQDSAGSLGGTAAWAKPPATEDAGFQIDLTGIDIDLTAVIASVVEIDGPLAS
jgi:hypothetical protein